ncbi:MAG: helix-turn-helix domain-containing protein [Bacteroidetes bacterium]|nr:helix-turn-helix domain-containing protein [Bacteroidota bacterium]
MIESTDALSTRTWLSIEQASEYTTFAVVTLRKMVYRGAIPFYKKGRRVVFKREEIDSWMDTSRVEPVDAEKIKMEVDQLISRERKPGRPKNVETA